MDQPDKGSGLSDTIGLGAVALTLAGTLFFTLLNILLDTTDPYLPAAVGMWPYARALFAFLVVAIVLQGIGKLPARAATIIYSLVSVAVVVIAVVGVAAHSDYLNAKVAEATCNTEREQAVEAATRRRGSARAMLKRCQDDFEEKKTIFSSETVEVHCRPAQRSADGAAAELKRASDQVCAPAATGSVPGR